GGPGPEPAPPVHGHSAPWGPPPPASPPTQDPAPPPPNPPATPPDPPSGTDPDPNSTPPRTYVRTYRTSVTTSRGLLAPDESPGLFCSRNLEFTLPCVQVPQQSDL